MRQLPPGASNRFILAGAFTIKSASKADAYFAQHYSKMAQAEALIWSTNSAPISHNQSSSIPRPLFVTTTETLPQISTPILGPMESTMDRRPLPQYEGGWTTGPPDLRHSFAPEQQHRQTNANVISAPHDAYNNSNNNADVISTRGPLSSTRTTSHVRADVMHSYTRSMRTQPYPNPPRTESPLRRTNLLPVASVNPAPAERTDGTDDDSERPPSRNSIAFLLSDEQ